MRYGKACLLTQSLTPMDTVDLPENWFERADNTPDEAFYREPRLVQHIDTATIEALTDFYRSFIPTGSNVLDLMSSWISHLPPELSLGRVAGLGMNAVELEKNPQLTEWCVQDLNTQPVLPYPAHSFERITLTVSIQYLIKPLEVMASAHQTLAPGGKICIAMSHRLFPTKAIAAFTNMMPEDRIKLVSHYLEHAGFKDVDFVDQSPPNADPLWLVLGTA